MWRCRRLVALGTGGATRHRRPPPGSGTAGGAGGTPLVRAMSGTATDGSAPAAGPGGAAQRGRVLQRPIAAQARLLELLARQTVASLQAGGQRSAFRGQGMEFDQVREYAVGDDARLIDWNVTSRMGSAFTKVFREERELNLVLVVDVSRSLLGGDGARRELAAWVVAILAHAVQRAGEPVSAYLFSDRRERWLPARRGRGHPLRIVGDVLAIEPRGRGSDLALALRGVAGLLHRRATCVLVSDFKTTGFWPQLAVLRRRHEVVAVRVGAAGDGEFPAVGGVELQDPETGPGDLRCRPVAPLPRRLSRLLGGTLPRHPRRLPPPARRFAGDCHWRGVPAPPWRRSSVAAGAVGAAHRADVRGRRAAPRRHDPSGGGCRRADP